MVDNPLSFAMLYLAVDDERSPALSGNRGTETDGVSYLKRNGDKRLCGSHTLPTLKALTSSFKGGVKFHYWAPSKIIKGDIRNSKSEFGFAGSQALAITAKYDLA
jgi:hypothetical protein